MALPSNNGIFIHEGLNCSPNYVPTAQSIPISTTDNTTVKSVTDTTLSNIAEDYDATATYAVGDCVLYQRVLYQCTTAITVAEAWNSSHWTSVKAVDVGSGGGTATAVSYNNTTSGLSATNVQDAIDEVALGVCNYSLSEKIVGKWVDNKTLYEKTIDITPITTDSSWHNVAHGISNIDKVVYVNGIIINNSNEFFPIPNIRPAQTLDNLPVGIEVNADRTNVRYMNNWLSNIVYCWVTIRYTKTV